MHPNHRESETDYDININIYVNYPMNMEIVNVTQAKAGCLFKECWSTRWKMVGGQQTIHNGDVESQLICDNMLIND